MSAELDDRKQSFQELQDKLIKTTQKLKSLSQQLSVYETTSKRSALTLLEVQPVSEDTWCYEPVGRAYFLASKSQLVESLQARVQECDKQVQELKGNRELTAKELHGTEAELRELLRQTPELTEALMRQ